MEALDIIGNRIIRGDEVIFPVDVRQGAYSGIHSGGVVKAKILNIVDYNEGSILTLEIDKKSFLYDEDDPEFKITSKVVTKVQRPGVGRPNTMEFDENQI